MATIAWSPALHDEVKKLKSAKNAEHAILESALTPQEEAALKKSFSPRSDKREVSLAHWY